MHSVLGLVAMQQRVGLGVVAHIGDSGDERLGQARISISNNVRIQSEALKIFLLGLSHFRVPPSAFSFRRTGRIGDRCIDNGIVFTYESFGGQNGDDGSKDSPSQTIFFEQARYLSEATELDGLQMQFQDVHSDVPCFEANKSNVLPAPFQIAN
jgi:hypothetical protein